MVEVITLNLFPFPWCPWCWWNLARTSQSQAIFFLFAQGLEEFWTAQVRHVENTRETRLTSDVLPQCSQFVVRTYGIHFRFLPPRWHDTCRCFGRVGPTLKAKKETCQNMSMKRIRLLLSQLRM